MLLVSKTMNKITTIVVFTLGAWILAFGTASAFIPRFIHHDRMIVPSGIGTWPTLVYHMTENGAPAGRPLFNGIPTVVFDVEYMSSLPSNGTPPYASKDHWRGNSVYINITDVSSSFASPFTLNGAVLDIIAVGWPNMLP